MTGSKHGDLLIKLLFTERQFAPAFKYARVALYNNNITDDGAIALAEYLKSNRGIKCLYLEDNSIGLVGAQALKDALKFNYALEGLGLRGNQQIASNPILMDIDKLTFRNLALGSRITEGAHYDRIKLLWIAVQKDKDSPLNNLPELILEQISNNIIEEALFGGDLDVAENVKNPQPFLAKLTADEFLRWIELNRLSAGWEINTNEIQGKTFNDLSKEMRDFLVEKTKTDKKAIPPSSCTLL